nr:hypothetical protein [Boudabousia tangfeifanii]
MGVAHHEGQVVFVRNALQGEKVLARPYAKKGKILFAWATKILKSSSQRTASYWADAYLPEEAPAGTLLPIGGGELCHLTPAGSLAWKQEVLKDTLRRVGGSQTYLNAEKTFIDERPHFLQVETFPSGRSRVEFMISSNLRPAMYQVASQTLQPVTQFPLATEAIRALDFFSAQSRWQKLWKPQDRIRVIDTLDGVFVRIGTQWHNHLGEAIELTEVTYPTEDGVGLKASPDGFWQAHIEAPKLLTKTVKQLLRGVERKHVLELFSGSGLLSTIWLQDGAIASFTTVEGDPTATNMARKNLADYIAEKNLPKRSYRIEGGYIDGAAVAKLLAEFPPAELKNTLILADPPRQGLEQGLQAELARHPGPVLLISCDPAAFARDAAALCEHGKELKQLIGLDMFPGTYHFETIGLFR